MLPAILGTLTCLLATLVVGFVVLLRRYRRLLEQITARERAEAERATLEQELRLGQKLEAVGRLGAGIAHEINTPTQFVGDTLRFLRGAFGEVLIMHEQVRAALEAGDVAPELLERVREAEAAADLEYLRERVPAGFERAEDGVRRIGAIVGAMREFAHPTWDKAPQDLNAALRNTLVLATGEYKPVAEVETDLGELPLVSCNGGEIKQVLSRRPGGRGPRSTSGCRSPAARSPGARRPESGPHERS
jgi:signal transduction histidine kinase